MFIPETIGTIASLLAIIDHFTRFSAYLSRREQRALGEAKYRISLLNPTAPVQQGETILYEAIQNHVPAAELAIAVDDLTIGIKALELYIFGLHPDETVTLPTYGRALGNLIGFIGLKLLGWHCFDAWGDKLPMVKGESLVSIVFLPMPKSNKALKAQRMIKVLPRSPWSGAWYFEGLANNSDVARSGLCFTKGEYQSYPLGAIPTLETYHLWFDDYKFSVQKTFPFTSDEYHLDARFAECLATGLLGDLTDYSRRVRGEAQKSEAIKNRLSGLLK